MLIDMHAYAVQKSQRAEYLNMTQKFTNVLVSVSLKLKKFPDSQRKRVVKGYLQRLNSWLRNIRKKSQQDE